MTMDKKELYLDLQIRNLDDLVDTSREIDKLQERLKGLQDETKRYGTDNKKAQEEAKLRLKEEREMYRQQQRQMTAVKGSLNDLRVQLIRQTAALDKNFVIGTKGWTEQAEKVNKLRDEVKKAEEATGRFQRNVGNYSGAITDAFGRMGGSVGIVVMQLQRAKTIFASMSTGMLVGFGAIALAIGAVIGAFKLLQDYYSTTTDRQLRLNELTALWRRMWDKQAEKIYESLDAAEGLEEATSGWSKALATVENLFKRISKLVIGKEEYEEVIKLQQDIERFRIKDNKLLIEIAEREKEYNRLRVDAANELRFTDEQRLDMAERAEVQLDLIAEKSIELKKEEIDLIERSISITRKRTADDERRLAELEADLHRIESRRSERSMRLIQRQISTGRLLETQRKKEEEHMQRMILYYDQLTDRLIQYAARAGGGRGLVGPRAASEFVRAGMMAPEAETTEDIFTGQLAVMQQMWDAEKQAAIDIGDEWITSYQKRLEALEHMHRTGEISEAQYTARVMQLRQMQVDSFIGGLRAAVGANAKAQQAVAIVEQTIAVGRTLMAIAKGTAESAAAAPPPFNLPIIAMFLAQTAGLVAQIRAFRFDDVKAVSTFSEGGYTGRGGKHEPAGIVHKGEVVWSQKDVAMMGGAAMVDALRPTRMRGYAEGGIVGMQPNRDIGLNLRSIMREAVAEMGDKKVYVVEREITDTQNDVKRIKVRGDL